MVCTSAHSGSFLHLGEPFCFNFILLSKDLIIVSAQMLVISYQNKSGFSGLEVACWPLVPTIAGSNPTEAVGFFRAKKSSARLPSEGK